MIESDYMNVPKKILDEIAELSSSSRSELVEILLASLDKPDVEIDRLWQAEAEQRIDAYDRGESKALRIEDVLAKYK